MKLLKNLTKKQIKKCLILTIGIISIIFLLVEIFEDGSLTLPRFETKVQCLDGSLELVSMDSSSLYCNGEAWFDADTKVLYQTSTIEYQNYLQIKNGNYIRNNN